MNEHVSGIFFKDTPDARIRPPEPAQKGQRKPLGLAPVSEDVPHPSALDGRSEAELASPATVGNVLEALDAAISIRSEIDSPLRVRIGHLENSERELKTELEAAKAAIETLQTEQARTKTMVKALVLTKSTRADLKVLINAEIEVQLIALRARRIARRIKQQKAAQP